MKRSFELRRQLAALPADHPDRPALEHERMTAELAELYADLERLQQERADAWKAHKAALNLNHGEAMQLEERYLRARHHCKLIDREIRRLEAALLSEQPQQVA